MQHFTRCKSNQSIILSIDPAALEATALIIAMLQWYAAISSKPVKWERSSFKGTLRCRLSHGYFSFTAKYISN